MDYQKREEIFSKEALTLDDVVELTGKSKGTASRLVQEWKLRCKRKNGGLRLDVEGMIHILDYFDAMGIDWQSPGARYCRPKDRADEEPLYERARRSICC